MQILSLVSVVYHSLWKLYAISVALVSLKKRITGLFETVDSFVGNVALMQTAMHDWF